MPVGSGGGANSVGVKEREKKGDCNSFPLSRVHW